MSNTTRTFFYHFEISIIACLYAFAAIAAIVYYIYSCLKEPSDLTEALIQPSEKSVERTLVLLKPKHLGDGINERIIAAFEK